jgi:hypothetical protein
LPKPTDFDRMFVAKEDAKIDRRRRRQERRFGRQMSGVRHVHQVRRNGLERQAARCTHGYSSPRFIGTPMMSP